MELDDSDSGPEEFTTAQVRMVLSATRCGSHFPVLFISSAIVQIDVRFHDHRLSVAGWT